MLPTDSVGQREMHLDYVHGTYETAGIKPSLLCRLFPSLTFYPSFVHVVLKSGRQAKLGLYDADAWVSSSHAILRLLERSGVQVHISGMEHVQACQGPCVFVSNHVSILETMVMPGLIQPFKDVTFVVKESLLDYPVFKYIMRWCDPVAVTRSNPRDDLKAVMVGGVARLAAGRSIIVFPQTTRTAAFDPEQFNTLGVKLARRAGVPVIPVALLTDVWGNGKLVKDFGRIDPSKKCFFAFGEPMAIEGRGDEQHERTVAFIQEHLAAWRAQR